MTKVKINRKDKVATTPKRIIRSTIVVDIVEHEFRSADLDIDYRNGNIYILNQEEN